jgi:hypothetical protein
MDTEWLLGGHGTMWTGLAVARVFSCLKLSRVVLDFLFCCHNLDMDFEMGDAPRSFNGLVRPLFHFPKVTKKLRSSARQTSRGGVPF